MDIIQLLKSAIENGASDVHLKVGNYPVVRVNGQLRPLTEDIRLKIQGISTTAELSRDQMASNILGRKHSAAAAPEATVGAPEITRFGG